MLFTSSRLVTNEIADMFERIPPMEDIEITEYGMSSNRYDSSTRTPGSFQEYDRGLMLLLDRHIPFIVKGALLPTNFQELNEFTAWSTKMPRMKGEPSLAMFIELWARRDSAEKNKLIKK